MFEQVEVNSERWFDLADLKNKIIYDDYKDMMKKLNINYNQYNYIMYDKKEKRYIFINDKK